MSECEDGTDVKIQFVCPSCGNGYVSWDVPCCTSCDFRADVHERILDLHTGARSEDYGEHGAAALAAVEDEHFWFRQRARFILDELNRAPWPAISRAVADLGCGTGYMMEQLESAGYDVLGADMHREGLRIASSRTAGPLVSGMIERIQLRDTLDAASLFDVIEHLNDDVAALIHASSFVRDRGFVFVTVPALMSLWSDYDERGGHKRRYDKRRLVQALRDANLEVLSVKYFFSFAVPPVWLQRIVKKPKAAKTPTGGTYLKPPSPTINKALGMLAGWERKLSRIIPMPIGTSLFALARVHHPSATAVSK